MSLYLPHIIGFSPKALRSFSSKSAINKITYRGVNFIPTSVLRTCLKDFSSNSKILLFSTISASSIRVSLEICLLSLNSKNLRSRVWIIFSEAIRENIGTSSNSQGVWLSVVCFSIVGLFWPRDYLNARK